MLYLCAFLGKRKSKANWKALFARGTSSDDPGSQVIKIQRFDNWSEAKALGGKKKGAYRRGKKL